MNDELSELRAKMEDENQLKNDLYEKVDLEKEEKERIKNELVEKSEAIDEYKKQLDVLEEENRKLSDQIQFLDEKNYLFRFYPAL